MISIQTGIILFHLNRLVNLCTIPYASIIINGSVKINGIRIIANRDGKILVVLPEDSEKKIQYVVPMNNYFRQYLDTTLVDRYLKMRDAFNKTAMKGSDPNG